MHPSKQTLEKTEEAIKKGQFRKRWATRTPPNTGDEHRCSRRVSNAANQSLGQFQVNVKLY